MKYHINKVLATAMGVVVLVIVAVLMISLRQSQRVKDTTTSVSVTEQILLHLEKLTLAVLENETGARGYVLTGKEIFVLPLSGSVEKMKEELQLLTHLVKDSQAQQLIRDSLGSFIDKRIAFSEKMVNTRRQEGLEAGAALVISGTGKMYTDGVRRIGDQLRNRLTILLETRRGANEKTVRQLNIILYTILGIVFLLSIFIIRAIQLDIKRRRLNEQKFIALLDAAPDATVIVNKDGLIQLVNNQTENLFGYARSEMIGKPVEILIPPELKHKHAGHRDSFFKAAGVRPMGAGIELNAVKKGGARFPVEISLSPIQTGEGMLVSASVRDITQRKKAAEQIAYMARLMEDTSEAVFSTDASFITKSWNKAAEKLYGFEAHEVIGKELAAIIRIQIDEKTRQGILSELKETGYWKGEIIHLKKDGSPLYLLTSNTATRDAAGEVDGYVSVCRDISERKSLEEQLKKTNAELEAFTYSVSHDLRAPLRGIIGFTAILEEDYTSLFDEEAKRLMGIIKFNTMKMGHLIDDLLGFSRMGRQDLLKTRVDMNIIVEEIIEELKTQNNQHPIEWEVQVLPGSWGDVNTLRQVWINLLSNAIKYSGKSGQAHIKIGTYEDGGQQVFYVKDNGVGFDEQYSHKLFKVFQRLHSEDQFEGTGVGLALVEKIIDKHGGKVWAKGVVDEGASFYFTLPLEYES